MTFRALALRQSEWRRANAWNVSFETLYGDQFHIINLGNKTKITLLYSPTIVTPPWVSLESYPLYQIYQFVIESLSFVFGFKALDENLQNDSQKI